jgi:hypothetical protein
LTFPPTRLLLEIAPKEETPARTPWWLTLMRLALAALVIIGRCRPTLASATRDIDSFHTPRSAFLIDDGWTAAATWDARMRTADDIITRAEDDRRAVALIPLSEGTRDISLEPARLGAGAPARHKAATAYTIERSEALSAISQFLNNVHNVDLVWLSDGTDAGREGAARRWRRRCRRHRARDRPERFADRRGRVTLLPPEPARPRPRSIFRSSCATTSRGSKSTASDPPARCNCSISDGGGARSAWSADRAPIPPSRCWHRPFYLTRALAPFADVRLGDRGAPQQAITQFLDQKLPMIVLADVGTLSPEIRERIARGSSRAACWCALPDRVWRKPTTTWCR